MSRTVISKAIFTLISILAIFTHTKGQENVSMGVLPKINLSFNLNEKFKISNSLESRQVLYEQINEAISYNVTVTDISALLSYKSSPNTRINGGYLLRLVDGTAVHRLIQQFNYLSPYAKLRFAHRFGTEQNFTASFPVQFRFRYRITLETPLNGTRLDPKEFYLKSSSEAILATRSGDSDVELRVKPVIGYLFPKNSKIEVGIDYRFNEFVISAIDHDFWLSLSWYKSF